jgi:hypothetical protein
MQTDVERMRHNLERGEILRVLQVDFCSSATMLKTLRGALALGGYPLTLDGLSFHLEVLAQQGYIELNRAEDTPGYRQDRMSALWKKPNTIISAKLLAKGLMLIDALIPSDPTVNF